MKKLKQKSIQIKGFFTLDENRDNLLWSGDWNEETFWIKATQSAVNARRKNITAIFDYYKILGI
jgi:hypothetical protein